MSKQIEVKFVADAPGQATAPSARFVLLQPNARKPDGSIRHVAPFEVVVSSDPLTLVVLACAIVAHGLVMRSKR